MSFNIPKKTRNTTETHYEQLLSILRTLPHRTQVQFAYDAAQNILYLTSGEARTTAENCLNLVAKWLEEPSDELVVQLKVAAYAAVNAAHAAAAAAYAAYAAAAAANAAYAAVNAAPYDAPYAANAAPYAAHTAAAAAIHAAAIHAAIHAPSYKQKVRKYIQHAENLCITSFNTHITNDAKEKLLGLLQSPNKETTAMMIDVLLEHVLIDGLEELEIFGVSDFGNAMEAAKQIYIDDSAVNFCQVINNSLVNRERTDAHGNKVIVHCVNDID